MAKLTAATRNRLPDRDFALSGRREPIQDRSHAKAALTMGMRDKSAMEKSKIRAAVRRKYPDMGKGAEHNGAKAHVGPSGIHYGAHVAHDAITSQKGHCC